MNIELSNAMICFLVMALVCFILGIIFKKKQGSRLFFIAASIFVIILIWAIRNQL